MDDLVCVIFFCSECSDTCFHSDNNCYSETLLITTCCYCPEVQRTRICTCSLLNAMVTVMHCHGERRVCSTRFKNVFTRLTLGKGCLALMLSLHYNQDVVGSTNSTSRMYSIWLSVFNFSFLSSITPFALDFAIGFPLPRRL